MLNSIDYLLSVQHESGGWGYSNNQMPVVESTSLALLAIRDEPEAQTAYQKGIHWLKRRQHKDGGWGINETDTESGWQTAWALIALRSSKSPVEGITSAENWLIFESTFMISHEEFLNLSSSDQMKPEGLVWPWLPGQGVWLEPTALVVLALRDSPENIVTRLRLNAAAEYFAQNRTPRGGWDIGNAGILDTVVLPRAYTTALVILAYAQINPQSILDMDHSALIGEMQRDTSLLSKSIGLLALQMQGKPEPAMASELMQFHLSNGSWNNSPFITAWATIGLRGYL